MVLISHLKKFIYIKNSKVAGTSVEAYFERYCLDPNRNIKIVEKRNTEITKFGIIGNREDGISNKFYNLMSANEIKKLLSKDIFNSYFKFCVVRNPYDKMVSLYNMLKNRNKLKLSFEEFCKRHHCINYKRYFINNKSCIDFYIRFEYLKEDLEKVCNILNIKFDYSLLPKFKTQFRKDNDYRKYYTEETKKIVYEKHIKEFKMFNYKF